MTVPWWDLAVNFTDELIIIVLCVKKPPRRCVLYTRIHSEWLYINSAPRCILLCVFSGRCYLCSRAVWIHCCHCTLQSELCVFVMYENNIDFSLPLKTNKTQWKKKRRKFGFILLSLSQSKPSAFCVLNLFLQENQELNRQALASVVMIDRCLWSQRSEDFSRGLKQLTNVFQHFD